MHRDVHYHPVKFEVKIHLVYGETKRTNCIMGQNELNDIIQEVNWTKLQFRGLFGLCLQLRVVIQIFFPLLYKQKEVCFLNRLIIVKEDSTRGRDISLILRCSSEPKLAKPTTSRASSADQLHHESVVSFNSHHFY